MLQRTATAFRTRANDDGTLTIEGIAVPWDTQIEYGGVKESFKRGAFDAAQTVGKPLLWSHDRGEPIGHITDAADAEDGLHITAILQPTARGRDAITLLSGGTGMGLSVGFDPTDINRSQGAIEYVSADLIELSTTPLPAYPQAGVTATREEEPMDEETTTEVREVADLAPIRTRLDQLEARMIDRNPQPTRTLSVREAFVAQIRDSADHRNQIRALADVVSSGNAGLLPPSWSSEVIGYVDSQRYLIPRAGSAAFPTTGHSITFPKLTGHTKVEARGIEKTQIPSAALTTGSEAFQAAWYSGGVDLSLELLWQSDPSVWTVTVEDLLGQYAIATDTGATLAVETAAASAGAVLPTSDYAALVAALIDTAEDIRAATGQPGDKVSTTTASWKAILGLTDADGRRVLATTGGSNADGSAGLTSQSVNIGGIDVFHNPRAAADVQFNEKSFKVAEKPPVQLASDNVALMGRDLGVLGAIINLPLYPEGIVRYTALVADEPQRNRK